MKKIILVFIVVASLFACKKTGNPDVKLSAGGINVTNAVIGGSAITLTTRQEIISGSNNTINANAATIIPLSAGNVSVVIGTTAVAATPTAPAIPSVTYYTQTLTVDNSTNYSLFLTGTSTSSVDNLLIKENYAWKYTDSVCAVRFINLSPGSPAISVNVKGSANGSEVQILTYKAYSDFIQHPAKKVNASYIFEFRNASSGTLITSYTLPTPYFHNVTLCLRGIVGGSVGVIQDNDF